MPYFSLDRNGEYSLTEKLNVAMAKEDVWRCILLVPVIEISQIEYLNGNAEILFRYPLP